MSTAFSKPSFFYACLLRCPYCGKTPLLGKHWMDVAPGCTSCDVRFEREVGYFSGASQVVTYAFAAILAMGLGAFMVWRFPHASDYVVAGIPALVGGVTAFAFIPFGKALWLWFDHVVHPMRDEDRLSYVRPEHESRT